MARPTSVMSPLESCNGSPWSSPVACAPPGTPKRSETLILGPRKGPKMPRRPVCLTAHEPRLYHAKMVDKNSYSLPRPRSDISRHKLLPRRRQPSNTPPSARVLDGIDQEISYNAIERFAVTANGVRVGPHKQLQCLLLESIKPPKSFRHRNEA